MDHELLSGKRGRDELQEALCDLRSIAVEENCFQASHLGIPSAAAVTCVKPSGTVSQLVDAASGIHPRHARHYIRRVRGNDGDPLSRFLRDSGIPSEPCAYTPGSQVRCYHLLSICSMCAVRDASSIGWFMSRAHLGSLFALFRAGCHENSCLISVWCTVEGQVGAGVLVPDGLP